MNASAILVAPSGVAGALGRLIERVIDAGIAVETVAEVAAAVELSGLAPTPPCILVDMRDITAGEAGDVNLANAAIQRILTALPTVAPIVLISEPDPALVVACFRAGAGDVIDVQVETPSSVHATLVRIFQRQAQLWSDAQSLASLREMVEDLVKDLVRTERRSIDLEDRLTRTRATTQSSAPLTDPRQPAVLLVDHDRDVADELADRLETAGIATYAYASGEEAVREAADLAAGASGLDLALVAAQLPGINGLETVRQLRDSVPGLPAFLVTSVHDADLAAEAADLGVVGFVQKPLDDMDEVVGRLAQLAHEFLQRTREHLYVQRIKERHERILARYRSLPREA